MNQTKTELLFLLLSSAISGRKLSDEEKSEYTSQTLGELLEISKKHDVDHLLVFGLKENGLLSEENAMLEKKIFMAAYRYERINYEYENLLVALEDAKIPFIPLKGAVLRKYYPEPWMRTSCDIDILVHREDLENAILCLAEKLNYTEKERATHDVSLFSPGGVHVELHFDLVEEGRANNAIGVLSSVWDNAILHETYEYRYDMTDAFFYFYHIAHMAKHFETGGCGIRPFIDLWILDRIDSFDKTKRDELLLEGGLLRFADVSRTLSEVWFSGKEEDVLSSKMQEFILHGGVYGSADNRVALMQGKKGGRIGYIISRMFIPIERLKRYYPILEKHPYLMPFMQVRRWFMLLKPDVARMAKKEMATNNNLDKSKSNDMNGFLDSIGL